MRHAIEFPAKDVKLVDRSENLLLQNAPVLTIDGPAGSGKSSVSIEVARRLNWHRLDSGLLYRIVAYFVVESDSDASDPEQATRLLRDQLTIRYGFNIKNPSDKTCEFEVVICEGTRSEATRVYWGEDEVTDCVREETISNLASIVAVHPGVRDLLRPVQRSCRRPPGLVAEGRDMGTVVFPEARSKVFLTASALERARRRRQQLAAQGEMADLDELERNILDRDQRDRGRALAPLEPAQDAVVVDSTGLTLNQVASRVFDLVRN